MKQRASLAAMQEPALSFEGVTLSPQKEMVRIFYKDMWDHADKSLIPKIFHEGFTFRGSLGPTLVGHDQFAGYVDWATGALGQYTTDILAMIEEGNRVSGRCASTAIIGGNCSVLPRAVATYGG
jgi:SnoaL-like domain